MEIFVRLEPDDIKKIEEELQKIKEIIHQLKMIYENIGN